MMPNHGGGTETDAVALSSRRQQMSTSSAAARRSDQTADVFERLLAETHVQPGMAPANLSSSITSWTTGRAVHALSHPVVLGGSKLGPPAETSNFKYVVAR
jgi:hypothetical protein